MCMLDTIHAKRDEIHAIARKHKEERPDSDIDFLVEFGKTATMEMDALEENVRDMQAAFPWPVP